MITIVFVELNTFVNQSLNHIYCLFHINYTIVAVKLSDKVHDSISFIFQQKELFFLFLDQIEECFGLFYKAVSIIH